MSRPLYGASIWLGGIYKYAATSSRNGDLTSDVSCRTNIAYRDFMNNSSTGAFYSVYKKDFRLETYFIKLKPCGRIAKLRYSNLNLNFL